MTPRVTFITQFDKLFGLVIYCITIPYLHAFIEILGYAKGNYVRIQG